MRNSVLRCGKPTVASTKIYQQLGGFSPKTGAIHIDLQCSDRACEAFHPRLKQREEDGKSEVWPPGSETMWIKTVFNDVSANKRVTLRVRIRSGADSKGSNGAPIRPSRTTDKSQEGTPMGCTGFRHRTPHINAETNWCLPRGISSSSLRAAMATT